MCFKPQTGAPVLTKILEISIEWLLWFGENIETCHYVGGWKKAGGIENGYWCISGSDPALHGKNAKF